VIDMFYFHPKSSYEHIAKTEIKYYSYSTNVKGRIP
jgi:hypothetical protein